jgi:hypothetical protein
MLQKRRERPLLLSRDMDFSGEKSWLVEMHGHRLVVHGLGQEVAALLVLLLDPKDRVPGAACTADICDQASKRMQAVSALQMP